jgi:hypothetical protein
VLERQIRYYRGASGLVSGIWLCGGFAVVGVLLVVADLTGLFPPAEVRSTIVGDAGVIVFFGLGALGFVWMWNETRHELLLEMTPEGITSAYSRFPRPHRALGRGRSDRHLPEDAARRAQATARPLGVQGA